MTTQITIRIPDDLVAFVDQQGGSRASVIAHALRHERRRLAAERDAAIYASTEPDPDMTALSAWASAHPPAIDDDL